ncbi:LysE family translocator [Salipiger sp. H15]|uniref:LysE family translocator n=1 Tax=Alloyangia sp. H15 TaxID=3029062 RepID=A0AAU8AJZ0_9RHOB
MPDLSTLLIFAAAALALAATPGPDMLLIASRSAAQGRAAGFATWAGIAVGTYCHALAAALGLSQLFVAVPTAYDIVRYAGAAYLLYLAWTAFRARAQSDDPAPVRRRSQSARGLFRQGLLTNLLNPKMAIFVLALFPQFVAPQSGSVAVQIMVLATILNVVGFFVNGAVVIAASRVSGALAKSGRRTRLSQYVLGTVFAGLAARLAFDAQR